jgi:serine/threonine protein kinase
MSKRVLEATKNLRHVGRFKLESLLAQGAFGCVYEAQDTKTDSDTPVALKLLFEESSIVAHEVQALESLSHIGTSVRW